PAKALSVGVRVLASRKATISAAATAAQGTAADPDTSARIASSGGGGGAACSGGRGQGTGGGGGGEERVKQEEEEAARDVLWGVDALREAFGSALKAPGAGGKRLPLSEAAPRLLHLLRMSWLLAIANLALGRAAAASRLVSVAEHAYGARRSAWRRASLLLSTRPPGASAAFTPPPPPAPLHPLGPTTSKHGGSGSAAGNLRGG
ncbi:unnamed protein product, partial [Ectocarpus fasciculatus]